MQTERRTPVTSGLRQLFKEQWLYLVKPVNHWNRNRAAARDKQTSVLEAVENVVDGTDARIRIIGGYKRKLSSSVRSVLEHVEQLVAGLPEPIAVDQATFAADPTVNALFVNREELKKIFSRAHTLQAFFSSRESRGLNQTYALLFVNKKEKTVFGMGLYGDIVKRDVLQTSVSFVDHNVISACATENQARTALKEVLFNNIVEYMQISMTRLRNGPAQGSCARSEPQQKNLNNPQLYLETLINKLNEPKDLLTLHRNTLKISKAGVKVTGDTNAAANELHLNEVGVGDWPVRIVALVKYPRFEMLPPQTLQWEMNR